MHLRKLKVLLFSLIIAVHVTAVAEVEPWEAMFMDSNRAIGAWFDNFVEGVDLFLVGKRLTNKPNETSLSIENSTYSYEGREVENTTSIAFNPRLVNLEEYLHLKFTTYDERADSRGVRRRLLRQTPRERNYGATIGLFRRLGNIKTAFQPRIELQDPLKVSHSLSFESVAQVDKYRINPKLEFYANPTLGVGLYQAINFNFELSEILSLTLINEGDYQEKAHSYGVTNGFSIGHLINDTSSYTYSVLFFSNNRPKYHLDGYSFTVSWSEQLYKGMIDYSISPHLDFAMATRFKGIAGLTFTFNLNF